MNSNIIKHMNEDKPCHVSITVSDAKDGQKLVYLDDHRYLVVRSLTYFAVENVNEALDDISVDVELFVVRD